jgi:hypothetical protein
MEQMFEVARLHTVLEIVRRPILQGGPKGAQTEFLLYRGTLFRQYNMKTCEFENDALLLGLQDHTRLRSSPRLRASRHIYYEPSIYIFIAAQLIAIVEVARLPYAGCRMLA